MRSWDSVACDRSLKPFWVVLAIAIFLTVGCGGGSSYSSFSPQSNPPTNSPSTSNPQFTTNPPTTASEGVQYVYAIAATDASSGVVNFAITTGPTGAALSGGTLTWTPTQAQSRIANSFVVTATNATTGKTASQSWSVTPSGTIRGTLMITYVTETGDVPQPDDMAQSTTAAHVPNGSGYTTLQGVGSTAGTYSISGVPAGFYWLQQDQNFIWTNAANVDLGYATLGRPDLATPQMSTWITFALDGLNGLQSADSLEWFIANTNVEAVYSLPFSAGTTKINLTELWSAPLIDSSKGDRAYVGQLVTDSFSGKTIQVLRKNLGPLSITVTDGSTTNITGVMTDVNLSSVMRANLKGSAFSQYQTAVSPQAVNDATYVLLGALPGGSANGLIGYPAYLVTYVNANGPLVNDVDGDISYGNPFPTSWAPVLQYAQQFAVQYTAPGASNSITAYPVVFVTTTNLPTIASPLQPLVAPVVLPRINGRDFFQNQTAVGTTPTVSWQSPQPAPTGYEITLYRLYASGSDSQIELLAYLWTDSTTATLPPGLMSSGNTYLFRIRSLYGPGMDIKTAPYRQTFPWAYADVFSAMMNP